MPAVIGSAGVRIELRFQALIVVSHKLDNLRKVVLLITRDHRLKTDILQLLEQRARDLGIDDILIPNAGHMRAEVLARVLVVTRVDDNQLAGRFLSIFPFLRWLSCLPEKFMLLRSRLCFPSGKPSLRRSLKRKRNSSQSRNHQELTPAYHLVNSCFMGLYMRQ